MQRRGAIDARWIPLVTGFGTLAFAFSLHCLIHGRESSRRRRISGMTHVRTSPFYAQSNGRSSAGTNRLKWSAAMRSCMEQAAERWQQYMESAGRIATQKLQ